MIAVRVTLVALTLSTFTFVTTETLPIGLLPLIAADVGGSLSQAGLLVTVYGLVVVVASVPLTRLTRRLPRRSLLCGLLTVLIAGNLVSALVDGYLPLMAARVATALSHALFWAVVPPATAALVEARERPRALSFLYAGGSVAGLAGVPAGTWLGQQTGWRVAFGALAGLGVLLLVVVVAVMPRAPIGERETATGTAPDAGRYWAIIVYTALGVGGAFCSFTYVSPFLTEVAGLPESAVGGLLFVRGVLGVGGALAAGYLVARNGWLTMTGVLGVQTVVLAVQWLFASEPVLVVASLAVSGFCLTLMASGLGARVLETAPDSSDMAAAGVSTAFNVGITAGAFLGGVLIPVGGVRVTPLAGAALTVAAFAVVLLEPVVSTRRRPALVTATDTTDQETADG
ncbi:MFS transporter [Actinoplanes sp. NBRC 101535]|uniref:MFS transporter n=1 Tax=Actinoplanes sp. NBRC 101535 TaxID=3032196 RepID=UPI0024A02322|nr:MFS transporter [Actinoplanes sp. NBRC 101535]GLY02471.1 MFS transporter [Actinoplanes sp. NBRC 101535]